MKPGVATRLARFDVIGYLLVILWVNAYVCRDLFYTEYTGDTNSIQGLWIAMARLAGEHWAVPSWWPYHDGGIPFENTYMPLVPGLTALYARLAGCSAARVLVYPLARRRRTQAS